MSQAYSPIGNGEQVYYGETTKTEEADVTISVAIDNFGTKFLVVKLKDCKGPDIYNFDFNIGENTLLGILESITWAKTKRIAPEAKEIIVKKLFSGG